MKRFGIVISLTVVLIPLFMIFMFASITVISLMNAITLTSMILFVLGAILFIIEGGVFYGIIYSFRRFLKKTAQAEKIEDGFEDNEQNLEYNPKKYNFPYTYPFLVVGIVLFFLSLCTSYFIEAMY